VRNGGGSWASPWSVQEGTRARRRSAKSSSSQATPPHPQLDSSPVLLGWPLPPSSQRLQQPDCPRPTLHSTSQQPHVATMGRSTPVVALAAAATAVGFATSAAGHALMTTPRQRGALKLSGEFNFPVIDPTAPTDFCPHCLNAGGTGTVKATNGGDWSPYDPLDAGARAARAADHGVCGDPATQSPGAHTVGGIFYHGGKTVATYTPGGVVDFEVGVTTSHNGFFEWWVCDLDACGATDLTNGCFGVPGACTRLDRVAHPSCEAGTDVACGPIQAAYPSRWYMPCRGNPPPTVGNTQVLGGPDGKMRYRLPAALTCSRCVIQWYWVCGDGVVSEVVGGGYTAAVVAVGVSGVRAVRGRHAREMPNSTVFR